ncbi:MAG: CidA/LrgA family protein [Negativicutes bacterium]|nr:CidA/LrgA family protein [Negativicutes bacterium]MDR3592648.1 CidA/LrgA family protein [Negativicutes bacterium]
MPKMIRWLGQLAILYGVYWIGTMLEATGLPVPGSVLGVVLLFLLLSIGVVKLEYVEEVADYLLKHLMFFFVPVAVGLMTSASVFLENGWILVIAIFVGAAAPCWAVGVITQTLRRRRGECNF